MPSDIEVYMCSSIPYLHVTCKATPFVICCDASKFHANSANTLSLRGILGVQRALPGSSLCHLHMLHVSILNMMAPLVHGQQHADAKKDMHARASLQLWLRKSLLGNCVVFMCISEDDWISRSM